MPLGMKVDLGPGHIVLDGDPAPSPMGHSPLIFGSCLLGPNDWSGWIKMPLGAEVGLSPGHIVLDGDPSPPKGHSLPQFLAHVCCGEIAGLIEMLLGTEVGLSPGHIVLDGDLAPPKKGAAPTLHNFRLMAIVT